MNRWLDTAAVLLFAGVTAAVGLHAKGCFTSDAPAPTAVAAEESYAERVAAALPHLERHVAVGSMRERGLACNASADLAEIASLEVAIGDGGEDRAIAVPLAEGLMALRECVACTPEPSGCAAAVRAFTIVEGRMKPPNGS